MGKLLSNSILDLAKCSNQKTCTLTFLRFPIGALPGSKIYSKSIFLIKYYIVTILKKNWSVSTNIYKVKKRISNGIFKCCAEGFKGFFSCPEQL